MQARCNVSSAEIHVLKIQNDSQTLRAVLLISIGDY